MRANIAVVATAIALLVAVGASSAFAETTLLAEWLINGAAVTGSTSVKGTGEGLMEDTKLGIAMKCSFIGIGVIGSDGSGEITEVLSLSMESPPLLCKSIKGCEESSSDLEVTPHNLPYKGLLSATESGKFLSKMTEGLASFTISCLLLGIKTTEECSGEGVEYEVRNVVSGVEAVGEGLPRGSCTIGGAGVERLEALPGNLLVPTAGGTLSMSD